MKLIEILTENYANELETAVNDLIITAKGTGIESIPTNKIISQLNNMGFTVSKNTILDLLNKVKGIDSATLDTVDLVKDMEMSTGHDDEKNKDTVDRLAKKTAKKDLKK